MKRPCHNTPLLDAIARRLKELRRAKGVSQETAYEDTGLHIGRIEADRNNITVSTLSRLCDYYDITLTEFFEGLAPDKER